ncbi:MAG: hypothetical protein IPL38_08105 [Rhodobacter sp.]|nr:hypothetical protein [Rhodobacter sp.]MBK8439463.1 hypothetical protein [Rhodobacter sp.]
MILIATILLVFVVIFMVPVAVYGAVSAATGLMPPGDRPFRFLAGVAVSKLGTAAAFVLIWHLGGGITGGWPVYAALWFAMLGLGELGQALGPDYSWTEAAAGLVSEAIYLPLAGWATAVLLG